MTEDSDAALTAREERNASPERLLTFTDGVFAIIITILVLEIKVPDLDSGESLIEALEDIRPTFVAFVISFLLVGMYWVWHRSAFAQVRYIDLNTVWLNLLFLLTAALIPFATSTLGEYEADPTALHLYGAVLIAVTLFRIVLDWYLRRHPGLLWRTPSKEARRLAAGAAAAPLVVYAIAMVVADWVPWLSLLLYLLLPLLYFGFVWLLKADPRTQVAAQDLS
jgi:uncharacterized membrane protein